MNKSEKIVYYDEIGTVRYVSNRQAKNLSIRINQQGEVRVTIPRYVSQKKAETFLISKKRWIIGKLTEISLLEDPGQLLQEGDVLHVRKKHITISIQKNEKNIEDAIWRILLVEGRMYLPERVKELAAMHGFEVSGESP